jgi:trehalose utilization protein
MFVTPTAKTTQNTSRHQAKYIAYTSPGWEHNPLYDGSANKTVRLGIIESCSWSSNGGGRWHKAHSTAGASSQGPMQQYQCKIPNNTSSTQLSGHIPWCGQIIGSCHPCPVWWYHTFHHQTGSDKLIKFVKKSNNIVCYICLIQFG